MCTGLEKRWFNEFISVGFVASPTQSAAPFACLWNNKISFSISASRLLFLPARLFRFIPTKLNWFFHSIESIECCWYNWLISLHNSSIALKNEFTTGNRNIKNAFNCNQTAFACCENIRWVFENTARGFNYVRCTFSRRRSENSAFRSYWTGMENFLLHDSINYEWVTLWSNCWRTIFLEFELIDLWWMQFWLKLFSRRVDFARKF